jgi:lysophospholipase
MATHQSASPSASEDLSLCSGDGTRLFGRLYAAENPVGNALVVHGYAEHGGRYREVCETLVTGGLNALAVDLRGHGRSAGRRGVIRSYSDYLEDVEATRTELEKRFPDQPLLLLGHSNGGLVVLRILADPYRRPASLRAAVISSPFLALKLPVPAVKRVLARLTARALPNFSLPNELKPEQLTSDPQKQRERELDTLCHGVASPRWLREAEKTQEWVQEFAHRIDVPTLWLVSGADELADPAPTRALQVKLRAPATYHEFPDMRHEVFNELNRQLVLDRLGEFCRRHFS